MTAESACVRYGSVCSGIEAVTLAWRPLGFTPAWYSEIDPFASAVLHYHYPETPNLGDMTYLAARIASGEILAPDVLVGGTPCQSFSVAGARAGLLDARGALAISYVEIANAIDEARSRRKEAPSIDIWENVPGVLSDRSNAFGCFLGALAGAHDALCPSGRSWTNAGCVYGPQRTIAWRVLDAQYFGLAQRRRRVFVVASARSDFDPAEVLFERQSVRRDTPPREATWKAAPSGTEPSAYDTGHAQEPVNLCFGGSNTRRAVDIATCLTTSQLRGDFESQTFVVGVTCGYVTHPLTTAQAVTEDGNGRGVPVVVSPNLSIQFQGLSGSVSHTLNSANSGKGSSEDGSGRGVPIIAFRYPDSPVGTPEQTWAAFAENSRGEVRLEGRHGALTGALSAGGGKAGQGVPTIASRSLRGRDQSTTPELGGDLANALRAGSGDSDKAHVLEPALEAHFELTSTGAPASGSLQWRVRRLMPLECERLQGMPDNYTLVRYRGSAAADGPRYKAIGNSMAVPCVTWIGRRLLLCLQRPGHIGLNARSGAKTGRL